MGREPGSPQRLPTVSRRFLWYSISPNQSDRSYYCHGFRSPRSLPYLVFKPCSSITVLHLGPLLLLISDTKCPKPPRSKFAMIELPWFCCLGASLSIQLLWNESEPPSRHKRNRDGPCTQPNRSFYKQRHVIYTQNSSIIHIRTPKKQDLKFMETPKSAGLAQHVHVVQRSVPWPRDSRRVDDPYLPLVAR